MKKKKKKAKERGGAPHVYIHVPFCRRKCGYCAFYSETGAPPEKIDAWLARLKAELAGAKFAPAIETVYLGGGTPTLLSNPQLKELGAVLRDRLPLAKDAEVTIEANPETLDREKARALSGWVTRLSVGVQSFDPDRRAALGRDCSDEAIDAALSLGGELFPRLSCDLIYGVGDESVADWERELERALTYRIEHISCYELTVEEQARLSLTAPEEERAIEMWHATEAFLAPRGLKRYEISNYARPGGKSAHNRAVWRGESYLGFGPAAASFDGRNRWTQVDNLDAWLSGAPPERDEIPDERREAELFAVKLRTVSGWSRRQCREKFSGKLLEKVALLRRSCPEWFRDEPGVRLNDRGLLFWNSIAEFLL